MIIRVNGPDSVVARGIGSDLKGKLSLVLYGAGVGFAFLEPMVSYFIFAAVAVMWFVPDRRLTTSPEVSLEDGA
jgi:hypothetical protein